jgi:putrescine transport system permease protein
VSPALRRLLPPARWALIAPPYSWMLLFFAVPFAIALKISFARAAIAAPPYTALFELVDGALALRLHAENYLFLLRDDLYAHAWLASLKIALVSTALCLLVGYPMAHAIARMPPAARNVAILLVILPSWTSFLIRVYAWIGILKNNGLLNNLLLELGLVAQPLTILHTPAAVYVGIVYTYLPFMVLPLYANLVRLDWRLQEAACDLGARPWTVFSRITLPLSKVGIVAGSLLVLIPVVGEFVIPELLGGSDTVMIGRVLWQEFFNNRDWPVAAAVAIVMLAVLLVPIALFHHYHARELEGRLA